VQGSEREVALKISERNTEEGEKKKKYSWKRQGKKKVVEENQEAKKREKTKVINGPLSSVMT